MKFTQKFKKGLFILQISPFPLFKWWLVDDEKIIDWFFLMKCFLIDGVIPTKTLINAVSNVLPQLMIGHFWTIIFYLLNESLINRWEWWRQFDGKLDQTNIGFISKRRRSYLLHMLFLTLSHPLTNISLYLIRYNQTMILFIQFANSAPSRLCSSLLPIAVAATALLPTYRTYLLMPLPDSTRLMRFYTNWKAPPLKFSSWTQ